MKVVQINAVYGHGSTGIIVRDIEQLCEQKGIECYVASPDHNVHSTKHGYMIGNIIDHKIHALLCRIYGKQAYYSFFPTRRLCKYLDKIQPDIVHLHNLHGNFIHLKKLLIYLAKKRIRVIITLHDCWFFTGGCFHYTSVKCGKWLENCGNCPKRYVDTPAFLGDRSENILHDRVFYLNSINDLTVVGVSEWITHEAIKSQINPTRTLTIHNGVDTNVFKPIEWDFKKKLGVEGKFVILGPASKWFQDINKEALDYFIKKMPSEAVLLLFGCTKRDKKLPNNVLQIGFIKNTVELAALYTTADVMVNCSLEDSLSMINVEVQACGTPVVSYNGTGLGETVDGINSFGVSSGDYIGLFEKTLEVLVKKKNKNNDKLLRFVNERFDAEKNYEAYIQLYDTLDKLTNL